jgi:hypothetical protein
LDLDIIIIERKHKLNMKKIQQNASFSLVLREAQNMCKFKGKIHLEGKEN